MYNENPSGDCMNVNYNDLSNIGNYWKKYEGGIRAGIFDGEGVLELLNGEIFRGKWKYG